MYHLVEIANSFEPVTLDEAKIHLRVELTDTEEDTLIESLITAARKRFENDTNRQLYQATINQYFDKWPDSGIIYFPRYPVTAVTSLSYFDTDGTLQTWAADNYNVDMVSQPGRIQRKNGVSFPSLDKRINAVNISLSAGHATQSSISRLHKQAILLLIGHWFENRQNVVTGTQVNDVPGTYESIAESERITYF